MLTYKMTMNDHFLKIRWINHTHFFEMSPKSQIEYWEIMGLGLEV